MDDEDRYTRITLRIPKDLHARIAEAADATSKSQNAEIIARLQSTFADPSEEESVAQPSLAKLIRDVESIKERLNKVPIHVRIRSDGALNVFGYQMWTYDYLFQRGIEGENKHDHLFIEKAHGKDALALLEASDCFAVRTSNDDSDEFIYPQ